jgi:hypothetical protein
MSNDATKVLDSTMFILNGFFAPLVVIGVTVYLAVLIHEFCLVTLGVFLIIAPLNIIITRKTIGYRDFILKNTDQRIKLMNEVLQYIRAVKYYSWESYLMDRILGTREREIQG